MSEPGVTGGAGRTEPEELSEDGVKIGLGDEDNSFEPEEDPDSAPDDGEPTA